MLLDIKSIHATYEKIARGVSHAKGLLDKPLTLAEKLLYGHLFEEGPVKPYRRGVDYVNFLPDRVAMQDATAQMALLQSMTAGCTPGSGNVACAGFNLVTFAIGDIIMAPVSVCHQVSTMGQRLPPMFS